MKRFFSLSPGRGRPAFWPEPDLTARQRLFYESSTDSAMRKILSVWVISFFFLMLGEASGDSRRVQTFHLTEGWNAIWLAVEPADASPAQVFADSSVDIAAAYDGPISTRQYTTDPSADMLSELGWTVWYAPSRPDSFLTELGAVHSQKGYLVHSTSDGSLEIEGAVEMPKRYWRPNAFNLIGFCLDPLAPPSFSQFFSASQAHQACVIYRLVDGTWRRVLDPENEAMRSGEAFWAYCDGSSDYQGPLRVTGTDGIVLSETGDDLVLRNEAAFPLTPLVTHIVSAGGSVPMAVVVDVIDNEGGGVKPLAIPMVSEGWSAEFPTLEAGEAARMPLIVQTEKMIGSEARALLCITTDIGTETWLPVLALREELE